MLNDSQQEQVITKVLRPYGTLPHHTKWSEVDRLPFRTALPDTLAGLLRQFTARALDAGRLGFDNPERYTAFRTQIFTTREQLLALLFDWLLFWGITDEDGELRAAVLTALVEEDNENSAGNDGTDGIR